MSCAFTCLKLQGTELLSSNFAHCVTPLVPDQIKQTQCRNAALRSLREPGCAAQPLPGTAALTSRGDSASFLPLLFLPQPLLFPKNLGHLANSGSALPSCFCAVPQGGNEVGRKTAVLAQELSSLLLRVRVGEYIHKNLCLFIIFQTKVQNITNVQSAETCCLP